MNEIIDYGIFQGKIEKYECKCEKLNIFYNKADIRCWTAIINPTTDCIFVTYHINKNEYGDSGFDIISSGKSVFNIDSEIIYQTIEIMLNKQITL